MNTSPYNKIYVVTFLLFVFIKAKSHSWSLPIFKGYISLAQANFSNPHRIRYGQDFYDERMQATTRVYETTARTLHLSKTEYIL